LKLFCGLAQRNKGRKTTYFDGSGRSHARRENSGTPATSGADDAIPSFAGGEY